MSKLTENLILITATVVAFVAGAFMVLKAPQYHSDYIRGKTQNSVLLMHTNSGEPFGTGFLIEYNNDLLALTNDHICEDLPEHSIATVGTKEVYLEKTGTKTKEDLCLLKVNNPEGLRGLTLADSVDLGEEIMAVGHPAVMPYTLNRGQVIGESTIPMPEGLIISKENYDNCIAAGLEVRQVGFYEFCVRMRKAVFTTIKGLPGNSGSPAIDFYGNVVGVIFAVNRAMWLIMVPLASVKELLNSYSESFQ